VVVRIDLRHAAEDVQPAARLLPERERWWVNLRLA
jgi:hypothetical protein